MILNFNSPDPLRKCVTYALPMCIANESEKIKGDRVGSWIKNGRDVTEAGWFVRKQTSVTHLPEHHPHRRSKERGLRKMEKKFRDASRNVLCQFAELSRSVFINRSSQSEMMTFLNFKFGSEIKEREMSFCRQSVPWRTYAHPRGLWLSPTRFPWVLMRTVLIKP